MGAGEMTVAVVVASANRPELIGDIVADVDAQTWPIRHRVLSVPDHVSLPGGRAPKGWRLVHDRGAAAQRNAGIVAVPDADVIFFFDDDAVVRTDYVQRAVETFESHPTVVGLTGEVLLDGAAGAEISREEASTALDASARRAAAGKITPTRALYGCNFAYRAAAARDIFFDGRLPLYSWLEDHDFARRLGLRGSLIRASDCVIVHRGVKSGGRMAHKRFGYAQVMNPCYFVSKGSFTVGLAAREVFRPVAKNVTYSVLSKDRQWRRERLRGNALAALDVIRHRFTPERMQYL